MSKKVKVRKHASVGPSTRGVEFALPPVGTYFVFTPGPKLQSHGFHMVPGRRYVGVRGAAFRVSVLTPGGRVLLVNSDQFDGIVKILLDLGE